ncbi:hypothetical protein ABTH91_21670, partial [Acinetobacter baumannii]
QVGGSYAGLLLGGGLFLLAAQRWGMAKGCLLLALLIALLSLPWWVLRPGQARRSLTRRPASLSQAWHRPAVRSGLVLTIL